MRSALEHWHTQGTGGLWRAAGVDPGEQFHKLRGQLSSSTEGSGEQSLMQNSEKDNLPGFCLDAALGSAELLYNDPLERKKYRDDVRNTWLR